MDIKTQSIFDKFVIPATDDSTTLIFQNQIGAVVSGTARTEVDTNLTNAGKLPAGQSAKILRISYIPHPGSAAADVNKVTFDSLVILKVGDVEVYRDLLVNLNAGCGPVHTNAVTNGIADQKASEMLRKIIEIPENVGFSASVIHKGTAPTNAVTGVLKLDCDISLL